jgi:hypothetical protein
MELHQHPAHGCAQPIKDEHVLRPVLGAMPPVKVPDQRRPHSTGYTARVASWLRAGPSMDRVCAVSLRRMPSSWGSTGNLVAGGERSIVDIQEWESGEATSATSRGCAPTATPIVAREPSWPSYLKGD